MDNELWGIAKRNTPVSFSGLIDMDEESTLENNEYSGIGSM
jgi:hypothetical protein